MRDDDAQSAERYRVLERVGEGAFGEVFLALDRRSSTQSSAPQRSASQSSAPQRSASQRSASQRSAPQSSALVALKKIWFRDDAHTIPEPARREIAALRAMARARTLTPSTLTPTLRPPPYPTPYPTPLFPPPCPPCPPPPPSLPFPLPPTLPSPNPNPPYPRPTPLLPPPLPLGPSECGQPPRRIRARSPSGTRAPFRAALARVAPEGPTLPHPAPP